MVDVFEIKTMNLLYFSFLLINCCSATEEKVVQETKKELKNSKEDAEEEQFTSIGSDNVEDTEKANEFYKKIYEIISDKKNNNDIKMIVNFLAEDHRLSYEDKLNILEKIEKKMQQKDCT